MGKGIVAGWGFPTSALRYFHRLSIKLAEADLMSEQADATTSWERRMEQINAKMAQQCGDVPRHPTCIWHQLSQADMSNLLAPSGRTPALHVNGQPAYSYLHRAWIVAAEAGYGGAE